MEEGFHLKHLSLLLIILTSTAVAETNQLSMPIEKKWTINLGITQTNNLYDFQDGSNQSSLDYSTSGSYKLSNKSTLGAVVNASQDMKNSENNDFTFSRISYTQSEKWINNTYRLSTFANLPIGKNQIERQSLLIGAGVSLAFSINPDYLISKKLSLSTGVSLTRNFHKYLTATNGQSNIEYKNDQFIDLGYELSSKISLSGRISRIGSLSYMGSTKESYDIFEEIAYQASKDVQLSLGHQNAGSTLKPNGQDTNVEVLNKNSSVYYGGINITY